MKEIIDPYIDNRYYILRNKLGITDIDKLKVAESDIVITRIAEIFKTLYFEPSSEYLRELHKYLFGDVYDFAGEYRTIHVEKAERALAWLSVDYDEPEDISDNVEKVFEIIRSTDFYSLDKEERIDYVTNVLVDIWKTHPFREGNTRTALVFLRCFLKSYGIEFDTNLFKRQGTYKYTRDALVAASFEADDLDVKRNYTYIKRLIRDILEEDLENKKRK